MKRFNYLLATLFVPLFAGCVYNNGISKKTDYSITAISCDVSSIELKVGNDGVNITPTITGEGEFSDELTISIADNTIASISSETGNSGTSFYVAPIAVGETKITVTAKGDKSKKAYVDVKVTEAEKVISVESVSLDVSTLSLKVGETHQFTAIVLPENANNKLVSYESSDESILTISETGLATAIKKGSATVKVTTKDGGKTATCEVEVKSDATVKVNSYYLCGTPNSWKADADYELSKNESPYSSNEWMITFSASANDEFKVIKYGGEDSSTWTWYQINTSTSGCGSNATSYVSFTSSADGNFKILKSGKFTLYFDASGSGSYKYWIELVLN